MAWVHEILAWVKKSVWFKTYSLHSVPFHNIVIVPSLYLFVPDIRFFTLSSFHIQIDIFLYFHTPIHRFPYLFPKMYLEPSRTSKMELFCKNN